MREEDPVVHSIRSHGAKVARTHRHDWLILVILAVIEVVLNVINPFHRFVGKDMMDDLKYPMKDNTVPIWAVPLYAILLPIAIFIFLYIGRKNVYDLHDSTLGLLFAMLITGVITDSIKIAVGRPRPDFFWRCFPDGKDGLFAGLGFLSLYLAGKIKAFNRKGHVAKLCVVFLPILAASLVGISRVDDYWHHWQDVFTGGLIGLVVATFCYLQFFPPPYNEHGWRPYAYFRALEESRFNANGGQTVNALHMQAIDLQIINQRLGQNGHEFTSLDEMEAGHR